jgi:CelD/BcsL family acetyltransferase involved in cellulose biosynthesis
VTGTAPPAVDLRACAWSDCTAAPFVAAWDALAQRASEPNPFYESWYLLASLSALDPAGSVRLLVCEAGGELVGLLPVAREARYYGRPLPHLASWSHANCFLGAPLVAAGREREFWRALLGWADREAGCGLFLHLAGMPLGGPLHRALDAVLAEQSRTAGLVHREERAMLQSAEAPEDYLAASLSAKKRKELRRQRTRLAELGEVDFTREQDDEGLEGWIDSFLELEQAGWKGRAGSALAAHPATAALLRDSLRGAAARGRLERLTLSLDGRAIAMLANFIAPPGMFSFKTAYDEDYARYSPGVLLQCENLQALARPEIAWSDSCAAADHPMIDHIWRERRAVGRISIAIGGKLRRAAFHTLLRFENGRSAKGPAA